MHENVREIMSRVRLLGNTLGVFLLISALTTNMYASDEAAVLTTIQYIILILIYSVACIPLLFPLRLAHKNTKFINAILLILTIDIIYFFVKACKDFYWSLLYGEKLQQIMFPVVGLLIVVVLISQYSEIRVKK